MIYLLKVLQSLFGTIGRAKGFLPVGVASLFLIIQFFINMRVGLFFAFEELGKAVFAAELVINENVHLAIMDSQQYGFRAFFHILVSIFIIYKLVKFFAKLQIKITGSQAEWGAFVIALFIVGIIEISAIKLIDGQFGFIPIWDGIVFLFLNITPVLINVF
jgi:hypothetical protein